MKTVSKVFYYTSMIGILLTTLIVFYIFYLIFFPATVITLDKSFTPFQNNVKEGNTLGFQAHYCKNRKATSFIYQHLESMDNTKRIIPLPPLTSDAPKGCGEFLIFLAVPSFVPEGNYRLVLTIDHPANVIRHTFDTYYTEPFTITHNF